MLMLACITIYVSFIIYFKTCSSTGAVTLKMFNGIYLFQTSFQSSDILVKKTSPAPTEDNGTDPVLIVIVVIVVIVFILVAVFGVLLFRRYTIRQLL
jgi:hypothetical protein